MAELKRWSGNDTTDISIDHINYSGIIKFAKKCKGIYIFGNGHIGTAMYKFLTDSGFAIKGALTSNTLDNLSISNESDGIIISVGDNILPEVMPLIKKCFREENIYIPDATVRETIGNILDENLWRKEFWLNIYVTNSCNLGCRSCSAFAPICTPDYYDLHEFKNDIKRIYDLNLDVINEIKFTGAEAMLHPNILQILEYARSLFPNMSMEVYTNGLFIKGCKEETLIKLAELNVILVITEYPVPNLDLSESYKKLDENNVSYYVIYSEEQKYFSKRPLRFEGDVPKERYIECPRYKMCRSLFLFKGRLYKCIYALSHNYVNQAFDKKLKLEKDDYLDIYSIDAKKVYEYATRRIPFCRYCLPIEERVLWGVSEKKLDEWA